MTEMVYYRNGKKYVYDTLLRDDEVLGHPVKMTQNHTVIDQRWSIDHVLDVQQAEREMAREICGAPKSDGTPCKKYPLRLDDEPFPEEIGRCELHRPSMTPTENEGRDSKEIVLSNKEVTLRRGQELAKHSPATKMVMRLADDLYMHCQNCVIRGECEKRGDNNNRCIIEKERFSMLLSEMVAEEGLTTVADHVAALSVVDTVIKMIRTSIHESTYGIQEALAQGTAQYNAKLKELLYKGLKNLAIDRKTKITITRGGRKEKWDGSIAQALSNIEVAEVEVKSAKVSMKKSKEPELVPPVGFNGKVIEDDVPLDEELT